MCNCISVEIFIYTLIDATCITVDIGSSHTSMFLLLINDGTCITVGILTLINAIQYLHPMLV